MWKNTIDNLQNTCYNTDELKRKAKQKEFKTQSKTQHRKEGVDTRQGSQHRKEGVAKSQKAGSIVKKALQMPRH